MAKVFLSYDRDDTERARPIALALEKAGHAVWWDLHIRGGAQYTKVIEEALAASDAVVVLWSAHSIESAWVRDEAAAGRDSGRLVPIHLDGVTPPMGFRQFQGLDFSGWKGRGKPPHMDELLTAVESIAGQEADKERPVHAPIAPVGGAASRWKWAAAVAVAIVLALTGLLLYSRGTSGGVQTIAVVASEDSAKPLARDLLVKLGALQSAKAGSMRLLGGEGGTAPKADLIFEASGDPQPTRLSANLLLKAGEDDSVLWSKDFQQESGTFADLKQQVAFTAARVLECAVEVRSAKGRTIGQPTQKIYLNACAQLAGIGETDASSVVPALTQVTKDAPWFEGGWAKLLTAETLSLDPSQGEARNQLRQHIEAARRLDPAMAEISLAEATLLGNGHYIQQGVLLDRAAATHPDDPEVLGVRSYFLYHVGRMREGIEDARRSVELDPLSPQWLNNYVSALMYGGRIDDARHELEAAEQLWPGTQTLNDLKFRFHLRYGDPAIAAKLSGRMNGPVLDLYLRARANPSPENVEAVVSYVPRQDAFRSIALSNVIQAMAEFHHEDQLFELLSQPAYASDLRNVAGVFFRPAFKKFREDPRFMRLARSVGLADYWSKTGHWPDYCFEPDLPYDCKAEAAKLAGPS